jgi:hypothetical protein
MKEHWVLKGSAIVFFTVMFFNLLFLDLYLFQFSKQQPIRVASSTQQPQKLFPFLPVSQTQTVDLQPVYDAIYQATASLTLAPTTPATIIREVNIVEPTPTRSGVDQDYFIAFGSGTISATDWTDVPGLSVSVDSTKYTAVKHVLFEASIFIPTGNQKVYVRLYNSTDKHPVWYSEMSHEGGEAKLLVSPDITLDTGVKVYQVQMKTQLGFSASLAQSRLRITAE